MYIASEHIERWVQSGKANVVPATIAAQLGAYLNQLPWLPGGGGLDWTKLQSSQANLSTLTNAQLVAWLRSTRMGDDPFLVFWYVADQPCIACNAEFAISNVDHAFWKAPGKRYVFGARVVDGCVEPAMSHFAEFDGADTLVAAL